MDTENSTKQKLIVLNKLLGEIFQEEVRLSTILKRLDFTDEQIKFIRNNHLDSLVSLCSETLKELVNLGSDADRLWNIIYERFGLGGNECKTLQEIASTLGISRERVRQLENKALRKMKSQKRKEYLLARLKEQVGIWLM